MVSLPKTADIGEIGAAPLRPRVAAWLRRAAALSAVAMLSACAGSHSNLTAAQLAARYAANARGNYAPPGPPGDPWGPYIRAASQRFDVPQKWIRQVMRVESGGNEYMHGHLTVSPTGAMGLMQVEPQTYQEMASRYDLGSDPYNPYDNIMAGTAYIHEMYQIYGSPGFLAAYNAGPGRLDDYLDYQKPLPRATREYVAMIAPHIQGVYPASHSASVQVAMNQLPNRIPPGLRPGSEATTGDLNASALAAAQQISPAAPPAPTPRPAPVRVAMVTPPPVIQRPRPAPPAPKAPPPPRHSGFALIPSAEAATPMPVPVRASGAGSWAIQVGAYNTVPRAKAAIGIAELSAVRMLINGEPIVQSVNTHHGIFYRARFVHLSHGAAIAACKRLDSGPTGCAVLSPDGQ